MFLAFDKNHAAAYRFESLLSELALELSDLVFLLVRFNLALEVAIASK